MSQLNIQSVEAVPSPLRFGAIPMLFSVPVPSPLSVVLETAISDLPWPISILPDSCKLSEICEAFRSRIQTCCLPVFFSQYSSSGMEDVVQELKQDVQNNSDKLAFLLAVIAYSVQHSVADHCSRPWSSETMEEALQQGDVYRKWYLLTKKSKKI